MTDPREEPLAEQDLVRQPGQFSGERIDPLLLKDPDG